MRPAMEYSYVLYVGASAEQVWDALTDAESTAAYWGHRNVSDWAEGSRWEHVRVDGSGVVDVVGEVVESRRPERLVTTWADPAEPAAVSRVAFDVTEYQGVVRLTLTHTDVRDARELADVARGWPAVLSNLKTALETGRPLATEPWTVPEG
ncbi:SRPBCC domain-containing protein [Streptomyces sp. V2]|uniref:SRPBCC domain-containing protein n=2 Tax=Streptomyces TaxID=1883 RepID=UPI001F0C2E38|nr:SRPBCC domain-containing protein [Streptomyces sp. V2]